MPTATTRPIERAFDAGYPAAQVDDALAQLQAQWPGLLALRFDRQPRHEQRLKRVYLILSSAKPGQSGVTVRLQASEPRAFAGKDEFRELLRARAPHADTHAIADALETLYAFNPFGAWAVAPAVSQHAPVVLDAAAHVLPAPFERTGSAYLLDLAAELAELLPAIARIQVRRLIENGPAGARRHHAFLRCIDRGGRERAAIDAAMLTMMLTTLLLPEHGPYVGLNRERQRCWDDQLELHPADSPLVMHTLHLLCQTLAIDAIELHPQG